MIIFFEIYKKKSHSYNFISEISNAVAPSKFWSQHQKLSSSLIYLLKTSSTLVEMEQNNLQDHLYSLIYFRDFYYKNKDENYAWIYSFII